jgi:hypothetical protein
MRNEIACFGCGQATFRLVHAAGFFAPVLPAFAFDFEAGLLIARAMFSPRREPSRRPYKRIRLPARIAFAL